MADAAMLARNMPGLGNPLMLPVDDFNAYLHEVYRHLNRQADDGPVDPRSYVDQQMGAIHGR